MFPTQDSLDVDEERQLTHTEKLSQIVASSEHSADSQAQQQAHEELISSEVEKAVAGLLNLSTNTMHGFGQMDHPAENRYDGVKVKNIGFYEGVFSKKRSHSDQNKITDYLPGVDTNTYTTANSSEMDIVEYPEKKRASNKKIKKNPEEIQNDWKNEKFNLTQYSKLIVNLTGNKPMKPIYIYFNTNSKDNERMCQMLKSMGECESFVLKYYNEDGNAIEKSDEQPLSKVSSRNGKIAIIVLDTVTKIIDGNFISLVNSRIRKHDAGGAILMTGIGANDHNVYRFENTKPINVVLMKNFEETPIQCENPFSYLVERIRKTEKRMNYIQRIIFQK